MHLLKEISLPVRIGLITTGQPTDGGTMCGGCLGVQRVLSIPIHRSWEADNRRVPALARQLEELHAFEEDLREVLPMSPGWT